MRIAYTVALEFEGEGTSSFRGHSLNFIWKSKAPPKVVLFAWRCVQNALPTFVNLQRRGVPLSDGCGGCEADSEDIVHVLFFCNFARLVWPISGLLWGALR
ncbi:UNVERIFIED_CONTAM: hypothetical protein Slati_3861400 [Sesamum latifolium]|uniref:Reverse transcriptase zinc-binding domain-containing protein n=1 Tax=Sesamum latifolium TaxID=2727402 RepID=A0AAW2TKI7_9LAMI